MKKIGFTLCFLMVSTLCIAQLTDAQKKVKIDAILHAIKLPQIPQYTISLHKYGGKGDGATNNKKAFDKAIKALAKKGGGTLEVPAGTYLINGPLHLISHMELKLAEGATLKFGSNPDDYPNVLTSWEGTMLYNYSPMIYAANLTDAAITGKGVIDGESADTWKLWKPNQFKDLQATRDMNHRSTPVSERIFGKGHWLPPHLIQFFNSENILVKDIHIEDAPFWCVHLLKCNSATIDGVSYNAQNNNNDGVDLEYTNNVLIQNVSFDNADDNIAIKAGRDHEGRANEATPTQNVVIRNCLFKGLHGLVIGSEMSARVKNVFVDNCKTHGYVKRGIYFKTNPDRGGYIKDIYISNIQIDKTEDCFYITAKYAGEGKGYNSKIADIYIDNVTCREATETAVVIQGYEESKVEHVRLTNIQVRKAKNGTSITNTQDVVVDNLVIGQQADVPTAIP